VWVGGFFLVFVVLFVVGGLWGVFLLGFFFSFLGCDSPRQSPLAFRSWGAKLRGKPFFWSALS